MAQFLLAAVTAVPSPAAVTAVPSPAAVTAVPSPAEAVVPKTVMLAVEMLTPENSQDAVNIEESLDISVTTGSVAWLLVFPSCLVVKWTSKKLLAT